MDENLEPQEVRDARAADKNAAFKAAKDEAKVGFCRVSVSLSAIFRHFYRLCPPHLFARQQRPRETGRGGAGRGEVS